MTVTEFREIAMDSAEKYYNFLEQTGRGIVRVEVRKITRAGDKFHLLLRSKLTEASDLDLLLYAFDGRWHTSQEICPIKYDRDANTLTVRPHKDRLSSFSSLSADDLYVISDLKFLVKRVQGWYNTYGHRIHLPNVPQWIPQIVFPYGIDVSQQQQEAIKGALSSPFSYIWGAPGTGKTRVVLSSCVVSLVLSEQRVMLLAPTNNALEQMLRAVIPICEQFGISQSDILRLGAASSDFFQLYPTVCEISEVEERIKFTAAKIERIQKCMNYVAFRDQLELAQTHIPTLLCKMKVLASLYQDIEQANEAIKLSSAPYRGQKILLCQEIDELIPEIERHKKNIEQTGRIKQFFCRRWYAQENELYASKMSALKRMHESLNETEGMLSDAEEKQKGLACRLAKVKDGFLARHNDLLALTGFWSLLHKCASSFTIDSIDTNSESIYAELEHCQQILSEKSTSYTEFKNKSKNELQSLLEKETQRLESLQAGSTSERLKDVKILACTIDKYLALDPSLTQYSPSHVFLDEAGYVSLIKGLSTLSMGIPVTFLGDHMQLPPICEIDDREFKKDAYRSISLWGQSALYSECIFTHDIMQLCEDYLSGKAAPFVDMKMFSLDRTFRFGGELSLILADMVYTPAFHSAVSEGTELLVLDAPRRRNLSSRSSEEELDALRLFLAKYQVEDYAILTPYRAQRSLLLKHFGDNDVLTVHSSQGREWDTVFLSVVDTTKKWFTNSKCQESRGKAVINTAVSRAKKRLVLVCDYDYWRSLDDQLIGKLVQAARRA